MTRARRLLALTALVCAGPDPRLARAQTVPPDFAVRAEAGPRLPGTSVRRIDVAGTTATLAVVPPEGRATAAATVTGTVALTPAALACLYGAVTAAGSLTAKSPADNGMHDGTYVTLTVTAGGVTNTLAANNQAFAPIDDVARRLNGLVPASSQLRYNDIIGAPVVACP